MSEEISEGPSLRIPRGQIRFLDRKIYEGGDIPIAQLLGNYPPVRLPPEPEPVGILPTSSVKISLESGLQLEVGGGFVLEGLLRSDFPKELEQGSEGWEVECWIQFDEKGLIVHVFLETSSGDDRVDHDVLRALHQWIANPLMYGNAGWVKVYYQPDEAE